MGTLSGAEATSQIWCQFISASNLVPSFQTSFRLLIQPHGGFQVETAPGYCILLGRKMTGRWPFSSLISDSSMTGAGPEIPPSLRTRQKCRAINILAIKGIAMQCQI